MPLTAMSDDEIRASYLCDLELGRRRWSLENLKRYEDAL